MRLALLALPLLIAAPLAWSQQPASEQFACNVSANLFDTDPAGTNVRRGPGRDFAVVGRLPNDRTDVIAISASQGAWVRIEGAVDDEGESVFGQSGWVYAPLLGMTVSWNPDDPEGQGNHRLYAGPGEAERVLARIEASSPVTLEGCAGEWVRVRHQDRSGWLAPAAQCVNTRTECS